MNSRSPTFVLFVVIIFLVGLALPEMLNLTVLNSDYALPLIGR